MADTTLLKAKVEPFVTAWLEGKYPSHTFSKRPLPVGSKRDGSLALHEFDAVSEDNSIVAVIKSHSGKTSGGKRPAGKIGMVYQELYFLTLVDAKLKLVILTDEEFYGIFIKESEGKVAQDIEIHLCKLPGELQREVDKVRQKASYEQTSRYSA